MAIQNDNDARALAAMLQSGEISGEGADRAFADLAAYDAARQTPRGVLTPVSTDQAANRARREAALDQQTEQNVRLSQGAVQGIPEGARRLWGGAKQLGANLKDSWDLLMYGKPYVDRDPNTGQDLGLSKTSAGYKATVEEYARRKVAALEAEASGASPETFGGSAATTEAVAQAALPSAAVRGLAGPGTTVFGGMWRESLSGLAGNAIAFDARTGEVNPVVANLMAGGLPAVMAFGTGLVPGVSNVFARATREAVEGSPTDLAYRSGKAAMPDVDYTLGQRTGVPLAITLEQQAFNSKLQRFYREQTDKVMASVSKTMTNIPALATSKSGAWSGAVQKAGDDLQSLRKSMNAQWEAGMNQVRTLAGNSAYFPTKELGGRVQAELANSGSAAKLRNLVKDDTAPVREALDSIMNVLGPADTMLTRGITPGDASDLLIGLNRLSKSENAEVRGFAARTAEALKADLDGLQQAGSGLSPAAKQLLTTRADYKQAAQQLDALRMNAAYRMLGVGQKLQVGQRPTSDMLVSNFQRLGPTEQKEAVAWLQANAPELLPVMKNELVGAATRRTGATRAAVESRYDLDNLTKVLLTDDVLGSPMWTKAERARLAGVADGLSVINNYRPNLAGRPSGSPTGPSDVVINIVSRAAPFVARTATRIMTGTHGADFITDPRVYEALTTIKNTTGHSNLAARIALLELMQAEYNPDLEPAPTQEQ